jgi:hypothetical protein
MAINYNCSGQFCTNVLHYQFDDAGFATTAQAALALNTAFLLAKQTALLNILSTHVTLLSLRTRCVTASGGFESITTLAPGTVGARTGNMQVSGIGPVYLWLPTANSKLRGRMFVPGISNSDCTDGIMSAAFVTVLRTTGASLILPITLVGGGAPVATPVVFTRAPVKLAHPIGHFAVSFMLGQIRRRQTPV